MLEYLISVGICIGLSLALGEIKQKDFMSRKKFEMFIISVVVYVWTINYDVFKNRSVLVDIFLQLIQL